MGIYIEIGIKIRQLRLRYNLPLSSLAKELGYQSDTAILLIEQGKRKISIDKLIIICGFFDIPITYFLDTNIEILEDPQGYTIAKEATGLDNSEYKAIISFIRFTKENSNTYK